MVFFTADNHFWHTNKHGGIIKYCNRPFSSLEEMHKIMIEKWNTKVHKDDLVYILGDFCFRYTNVICEKLNGRKILVRGDHDKDSLKEKNRHYFEKIIQYGDNISINGQPITICHWCMRTWNKSHYNSWHIHGHSHSRLEVVGKVYDVGVDNNNFEPVSFNELKNIMDNKPDNPNKIMPEAMLKVALRNYNNSVKGWLNVKPDRFNINYEFFNKNITKESAYIMGFIWADGYLNNKSQSHRIVVSIVKEDFDNLRNVFFKVGKWNIYERQREGRRLASSFITSNFVIYDFLKRNDYEIKNTAQANALKILHYIPDDLKKYWWRGYFDGDGWFYYNFKHYANQLGLSGHYEQNWEFAEKKFNSFGIKYKIKRVKNEKNKYSVFLVTNKRGCYNFFKYIYPDFDYDGIGLIRKFDKFRKGLRIEI